MHDVDHVVVHTAAHVLTGNGTRIHQVVLDPDQVDTELTSLIVEQALQAGHRLAADVLIHDNNVRVEVLALSPQLAQNVIVAAVGVAAHDHALVQTAEVVDGLFLVGGVEHLGHIQRFHLGQRVDAPAVGQPVGEVGVEVGRAAPDECAVLLIAADVCGQLLLVGLHHGLADLALRLQTFGEQAAVHLVVPLTEQLEGGTDQLRIMGLVDLPLLHLESGALVHLLHGGEVSVPVPGLTGEALDPVDAVLHVGSRHLGGVLVVVTDGHAQRVARHELAEAAILEGRRHDGTVARHGGGDEALAAHRVLVLDRAAALSRRQRAGIGREAVALDGVDVRDEGQLVHFGDHEDRDHLVRDAKQVREAGHHLRHRHFVEHDDALVDLLVAADLCVRHDEVGDQILGPVGNGDPHIKVSLQQLAAAAEHAAVDHSRGGQVGSEPVVLEHGQHNGHGVLHDHVEHAAPDLQPADKVVADALEALPLTAGKRDSVFLIQVTEVTVAVHEPIDLGAGVHGGEFLELGRDAVLIALEAQLGLGCDLGPVDILDHALPDLQVRGDIFLHPCNVTFQHLFVLLRSLMNLLDLKALDKGLQSRAELTGGASHVRAVDGQDRPAILFVHDMACQRALECPEIAELHGFVDDAFGTVLGGETVDRVAALLDLLLAHVTRALRSLQVVGADLRKDIVRVVELDDFTARRAAEAETVGNDHRAGVFDHAGHVEVVDLGADEGHTAAIPRLGVDFSLLDLCQRFLQVREDLALRAAVSNQVEDMELITGDGRILELAHVADLGDDLADLIVLGNSLAQRLVGRIHAVGLGQNVQEAVADLRDVVLEGVVLDFVRDVAVGNEHLLVGHVGGSDQLDVLHAAVHLRAGVHTSDGVEEVIAALDRTLHECSAVLAGVVGHVVGCDVE